MKRKLSLILTVVLILSVMTIVLFSITVNAIEANTETVSKSSIVCDGVNHIYNNKILASQYLKSEATCVDRAIYYYSCSCGEKGEETFTSGSPLGHRYNTAVVRNLPNGDAFGNTYQICFRCSYENVQPLANCSTCSGDGMMSGKVDCPNCYNYGKNACCWRCEGAGSFITNSCTLCGGDGIWGGYACHQCDGSGSQPNSYKQECWDCDGTGRSNDPCTKCDAGYIMGEVYCTYCSGQGYHKHIEIQFDLLGGNYGSNAQVSTSNKLTISSQTPTKKGYVFVGWNTLENDQTIYQPGDTYTGDSTTFFAIWVPACTECGGRGYFTSQSTCYSCDGVGSYVKQIYKCMDCKTTNKINHIVGLGRVCGNCGSCDVSYVGTKTVDCSGCVNGVTQNSADCTVCSATGCAKVVAPTLVSKTSNQIALLLIEGMEYSSDGTTWQSSNIFTGLSPATTYTFYQRVANNGTVPFGATSDALTVVTACASERDHNKNIKCVCTICGIESHSLNENCICTACGSEKHALSKKCICVRCGIEKHSFGDECVCTVCGKEHDLNSYCVCLKCGTTFHQFESDTCIVCHNSKTDWDGSLATSFESGSGTSADPYIISTGAQLALLSNQVNAGTTYKDCYFELANDIDLKGINWNPIGNGYNNYYFGGHFDGKGYVIRNLTITSSYKSVGLFGIIGRATLCNVGVENIDINSTYSSSMSAIGGLVGFAQESNISGCYTKGTVYGINSSYDYCIYVGGLVGRLYGSSSITNSYSNTTVIGELKSRGYNSLVGGLIGIITTANATDTVTIENCYTVSTVRSSNYNNYQWAEAGGFIGLSEGYGYVTISNCFIECNISAVGVNVLTDSWVANVLYNNTTSRNCYYVCYDVGTRYSGVSVATAADFKSQTWLTDTLGWDFSSTWKIDSNQYPTLKAFARCSHSNTKEDTTYLKSAATCTSPAIYYNSCADCGNKLNETFEYGTALGHNYESGWTTDVQPTCTTDGSKSHHCTRCGDKGGITNIPSSGHSYGDWYVIIAPSCTETGTEEHKCSVCQHTETRTANVLGHTEGEWIIDKEATCTEDGSKHKVCLTCGETVYETIGKLGHVEGDWIVDKEATSTEEGSKHQVCSVCGYVTVESFRHTHNYSHVKNDETNHWNECACGEKTSIEAHTWNGGEITKEATAQEEGVKTYTCTLCSCTKNESIAKLVTNVKDTESGVKLEIPSDSQATLPAGTVIEVVEKPKDSISKQILDEFASTAETVVEALGVYDLNLLLDGVKIQPNGAVVVTLPAPNLTVEYDRIIVVFIAGDGSYDECKTTVNADGTISFETDHFSKYAVIGVNEEEAEDRIGVGGIIAIVLCAILVVGGGVFAVYWFVIKKKDKSDETVTDVTEIEEETKADTTETTDDEVRNDQYRL